MSDDGVQRTALNTQGLYILGQLAVTGVFEGLKAITQDTLINDSCHWA